MYEVRAHDLCSVFLRLFTALAPGRWAIPVLVSLLRDLRWAAKCADDAAHAVARDSRRTNPHMEECARSLNRGFSACVADRYPGLSQSKKWGTYAMVGLVFRTYFQLSSISLCKNILRALGAGDLPPLEAFPKAHVVTFHYYVGRLALLEEDYGKVRARYLRRPRWNYRKRWRWRPAQAQLTWSTYTD